MTQYTYEYAPYTAQDGKEIPAFEIFNEAGDKVAETNENLPAEEQEKVALLFSMSPDLLKTLEMAGECFGQHNLLSTATDEERRAALSRLFDWWNGPAIDVLAMAKLTTPTPPHGHCQQSLDL